MCSEIVGWQVFFFSCTNNRHLSTDLPQSSMTGLQRTLRTRSCISPTTAWTKRAAIMSGDFHQRWTYIERGAVMGGSIDSSVYYNLSVWSAFLPFQLRWPWSWGLWEQVEYECSVEVFEAGGEGHHMWVKPTFSSLYRPFHLFIFVWMSMQR